MNELWTIQLIGGLRVRQGERLITRFRTYKTGALLAYLAYHRQQSHSREVLIEMFWPETTPESGRHNLSHALSSLRSLLEPPGVPAGDVIIADRFTVELNPEAFTTDVFEFENALRVAAQARNTPNHAPLLTLALEKCTGELLPGYYEDWIAPAQERIRQRVQQATTQRDALRERVAPAASPLPVTPASLLPTGTVTVPLTDKESNARLPLQFTRFIGREAEIAQIVELLSSSKTRLLTLTGTGGTGKTRLSLEGAGQFANSFAGSVWFVPLAHLSEASLIPTAILQAMSIPLSGNKEPLEQAVSALQRQPTLLILDNFEQLVEGGAELVQSLLSQVSSLRCLVTSRQVLGLPGEVEFAVSPLATPNGSDTPERLSLFDSVRLFVDRAQASRPDFRITNGNAPAVAELCDRLEGIPLAIELAAARALVLSPSQMLSQLGNRFEFLVSRKRGIAERQRTLRATVDWSYQLLTPDVQQFFCQLCVFRGGWSLEAAEEICNEPLALDMLAQLRECSLITTFEGESGIRFRMLETLREYAQSQLSPEELAAVRERFARFFIALTNEKNQPFSKRRVWFERIDLDIDNIRAVLDWSLTPEGNPQAGLLIFAKAWRYWRNRGLKSEGCIRLEESIKINSQYLLLNPELNNDCSSALVAFYYSKNDHAKAKSVLQEALARQRESGDIFWIADSLNYLGGIANREGDPETAMAYHRECLALRREIGDAFYIGMSLFNLGTAAYALGDFPAARAFYEECLLFKRTSGDLNEVAIGLNGVGMTLNALGDKVRAREYVDEALLIFQNLKNKQFIAGTNANLAELDYESGNFASAFALLKPCLQYWWSVENRGAVADILERLGAVLTPLNQAEKAVRLFGVASRLRIEIGSPLFASRRPDYDKEIAAAREALGDAEAFERLWEEGRQMTLEQAVAYALEETGETV